MGYPKQLLMHDIDTPQDVDRLELDDNDKL